MLSTDVLSNVQSTGKIELPEVSMSPRHLTLMLVINVVWGFTFVASKYSMLELPPILMSGLRFTLLLALMFPFLRWHPRQMITIIFCALTLGALQFGFMFAGLARADEISTVAIAMQLTVPFTTIVSIAWLGEHVGWRRLSGIFLSFGGVVMMGFDPEVFKYIDGLLFVVVAAFAAAIGVPASKKLRNIGVFELQAWVAAISAPTLLAYSLLVETPARADIAAVGPLTWLAVVYTALGASLLGHGGQYYLIQRYDVSLVAPMTLLAPLFGVFFGMTLMGDQLTPRMVLGGIATLAGVFIIARREEPTR